MRFNSPGAENFANCTHIRQQVYPGLRDNHYFQMSLTKNIAVVTRLDHELEKGKHQKGKQIRAPDRSNNQAADEKKKRLFTAMHT